MSILAPCVVVRSILDGVNSMKPSDILEMASYNHPTNHVVVSTASAISRPERHIAENDTFRQSARVTRLGATHGFHSASTERILPELEKLANSLQWNKPAIPVELTTREAVDREPKAWLMTQHTRYAVHFSPAVQRVGQNWEVRQQQQQQLYCPLLFNDSIRSKHSTSLANAVVELWKVGIPVQLWLYHRSQQAASSTRAFLPTNSRRPGIGSRLWTAFSPALTVKAEPKGAAETTFIEFMSFLELTDPSKKAVFLVDPESERYMYLLNGQVASNQALASPITATKRPDKSQQSSISSYPQAECLCDIPIIDSMMQFADVVVNWFAHPRDKEVLLFQGIDTVATSGSFDITARQWIAHSLLAV
ncbi:hypothetical protein E4U43_001526 [Claviceps pusilla]|uniref:Uncharacterized protein n=1 Tax=Claviceps pusilla TaxID=123648 RepID=A0A9P7NI82_9HYPO|nr:hypothetical protein E4U43_001526 [Claviceps pusilla]